VAKLRGISIREVLGLGNGASAETEAEPPKDVEAPAGEAATEVSGDSAAEAEDASSGDGEDGPSDGEARRHQPRRSNPDA
jgi:hypothetical protein